MMSDRRSALLLVALLAITSCSTTTTATRSASARGPAIAFHGYVVGTLPDAAWTAADPTSTSVPLYLTPGSPLRGGDGAVVLTNPTSEGVPLVFRVLRRAGAWFEVQYPDRPNGVTAWVAATSVRTRPVTTRVEVHLATHEVLLFKGTEQIDRFDAAVGSADSPTPLGHFYVDARVMLSDPTGPYGAGQVSVTGFSTVYQTFGTGRGQIAIHGTNEPSLIGTPVSHGCVRLTNADLLTLINTVPTGTPVDVVP